MIIPKLDARQSPQWAKYLEALGWHSLRTAGGINVQIRKTIFGSLVKVQKCRPLLKNDLDEIEKICIDNRALFIKLEPYIGQSMTLLKEQGYETSYFPMTPTATYLVDLTLSEDELWKNVSHGGKYSVNRARREKSKVEFFKNPTEKQMVEFYDALKYTGKLQKMYVPPLSQIMKQVDAFGDNGYLITVKDSEGNFCGAKWHVVSEDMVLYVSGGTTKIGRKNKSGYLLVWESILYFKSLGLKVFDLEGKDDKRFPDLTKHWGGFSHFKEKFGGEVIEFPHPQVKYLNGFIESVARLTGMNF